MLSTPPFPYQVALGFKEAVKKFKEKRAKSSYPESKIKWIRMVALKIIDLLEEETIKYNKINPNEKILTNDLISGASTALNMLLKAAGVVKKKD
jgi:hypothetical protein